MKRLIILLIFANTLLNKSFAQQNIIQKNFAIISDQRVLETNDKGEKLPAPDFIALAEAGDIFKVIGVSDDKKSYIIQFLPFTSKTQRQKLNEKNAKLSKGNDQAQQQANQRINNQQQAQQAIQQNNNIAGGNQANPPANNGPPANNAVGGNQANPPANNGQPANNAVGGNQANQATQTQFKANPYTDVLPPLIDSKSNGQYFLIGVDDFSKNATDQFSFPTSFLVLSSLILPYKLNFGNKQPGSTFNFLHNVTIGPAIGVRVRTSKISTGTQAIDFLGVLGISSIQVDQNTLPGIATSQTNYSAFTAGGGVAFEFDKIQLGIFSGLDILTGAANHAYVYRNSPWLSIGIGFQIFSFKAAGASQ